MAGFLAPLFGKRFVASSEREREESKYPTALKRTPTSPTVIEISARAQATVLPTLGHPSVIYAVYTTLIEEQPLPPWPFGPRHWALRRCWAPCSCHWHKQEAACPPSGWVKGGQGQPIVEAGKGATHAAHGVGRKQRSRGRKPREKGREDRKRTVAVAWSLPSTSLLVTAGNNALGDSTEAKGREARWRQQSLCHGHYSSLARSGQLPSSCSLSVSRPPPAGDEEPSTLACQEAGVGGGTYRSPGRAKGLSMLRGKSTGAGGPPPLFPEATIRSWRDVRSLRRWPAPPPRRGGTGG